MAAERRVDGGGPAALHVESRGGRGGGGETQARYPSRHRTAAPAAYAPRLAPPPPPPHQQPLTTSVSSVLQPPASAVLTPSTSPKRAACGRGEEGRAGRGDNQAGHLTRPCSFPPGRADDASNHTPPSHPPTHLNEAAGGRRRVVARGGVRVARRDEGAVRARGGGARRRRDGPHPRPRPLLLRVRSVPRGELGLQLGDARAEEAQVGRV